MIGYKERVKINKDYKHYGTAIRISRTTLRLVLLVFCMITPMTNILLVFSGSIKDMVLRW